MAACQHPVVRCINPYEIIRKYRCDDCGEVMICACDQDFGSRFLPHQLGRGAELDTRKRVPVTLGFVTGVCNSCRGLPEEAHPKAPGYARGSKIHRYYWREIHMESTRRFAAWRETHGHSNADGLPPPPHLRSKRDEVTREVVEELKRAHETCPKYTYTEESQSEILARYSVEVVRLDGVYAEHSERPAALLDAEGVCSAEEFAARHLRRLGYHVLFTESSPFHALFGVLMWLLIQDSRDAEVRIVSFGDRQAFDAKVAGGRIWAHLPADLGTPGYASRRAHAIEEHLVSLGTDAKNLLWLFDYWVGPSHGLRQYLWAHRDEDLQKAREIASILRPEAVVRVLRYLVGGYWHRYCGWPDLLAHRGNEVLFAEVKSSSDKLSEDQKNWVKGNSTELHLPLRLIKIHRTKTVEAPSSQTGTSRHTPGNGQDPGVVGCR